MRGVVEVGARVYDYKTTLDLKVDDLAVVFGPNGKPKVVKVVQVEGREPQDGITYKWLVDRVDLAAYHANIEAEADLAAKVNRKKRAHQRRQVLDAIGLDNDDIKELTFHGKD